MSAADAGYSPLTYHNGTVWPHDNSLIALGPRAAGPLARGAPDRAPLDRGGRVLRPPAPRGLRRLPAHRDAVPDRVPDRGPPAGLGGGDAGAAPPGAARPAARPRRQALETVAPEELPSWAGALRLSGVRAFDQSGTSSSPRGTSASRKPKRPSSSEGSPILSPVWFPVPPTGYGGIEWVVSLLADGLADAGHDVTLFASGDSRTRAKLDAVFPEPPATYIGMSYAELRHALPCFERADEFDVINDHSSQVAMALGGLVDDAGRPHGARPARRAPARELPRHRRARPEGRPDLDLHEPAQARPELPWVGNVPNALDLDAYPYHSERGEYLLYLGRLSPDKGAHRAIEIAREAGPPDQARGQEARARRAGVLRRAGQAAPRRRRRVPGRDEPREEGRSPPERARHALPDRLGGAVRPGHDRVDGLRDAGDRDPARRRSRGGRRGPQRDHRGRLPRHGRRDRRGRQARSARVPRAAEEHYSVERMVADYVAVYEQMLERK